MSTGLYSRRYCLKDGSTFILAEEDSSIHAFWKFYLLQNLRKVELIQYSATIYRSTRPDRFYSWCLIWKACRHRIKVLWGGCEERRQEEAMLSITIGNLRCPKRPWRQTDDDWESVQLLEWDALPRMLAEIYAQRLCARNMDIAFFIHMPCTCTSISASGFEDDSSNKL